MAIPESPPEEKRLSDSNTPSAERDAAQAPVSGKVAKDAWDKAQIISGFLASVVIAVVGILINSSIQRAQILAADRNAAAQIAVAERSAKAQLDQAEHQAENQRRIQESTLTGQLVESLTSDNPLKRRIAIIALERSIPTEVYQRIIRVVVTSDPNQEVRLSASRAVGDDSLRTLSSSHTFVLVSESESE